MNKVKVLIVEDYLDVAEAIQLGLEQYHYEVTGVVRKGEEVVEHVQKQKPDIVLMDINLAGKMNGVETAKLVRSFSEVIIIYLTDVTDKDVFKEAKEAFPSNYLVKPFSARDTNRAIEMALYNTPPSKKKEVVNLSIPYGDQVYIKQDTRNYVVNTNEIWWIQSDKPHSKIKIEDQEFLVKKTMKTVHDLLGSEQFLQIHQSFIVNRDKINYFDNTELTMKNGFTIPLGGSYVKMLKALTRSI